MSGLPRDFAGQLSMGDKADTGTNYVKYMWQLQSAEKICQRPQDWNPGDSAASTDSSPIPSYRASRTNFNAHGLGDYNGGGSSSVLCYICRSSQLCAISVRDQDNNA